MAYSHAAFYVDKGSVPVYFSNRNELVSRAFFCVCTLAAFRYFCSRLKKGAFLPSKADVADFFGLFFTGANRGVVIGSGKATIKMAT
jgi:hypothetical protein